MTSLEIPKLDDDLSLRLQQLAVSHGRSVEDEAQTILRDALAQPAPPTGRDLAASVREKFAPFGSIELDIPPRFSNREPPRFDDW